MLDFKQHVLLELEAFGDRLDGQIDASGQLRDGGDNPQPLGDIRGIVLAEFAASSAVGCGQRDRFTNRGDPLGTGLHDGGVKPGWPRRRTRYRRPWSPRRSHQLVVQSRCRSPTR